MTKYEANTIVGIMLHADGGCSFCAYELIQRFISAFPDYEAIARDRFSEEFEISLDEVGK
jgi:hypothetical protein